MTRWPYAVAGSVAGDWSDTDVERRFRSDAESKRELETRVRTGVTNDERTVRHRGRGRSHDGANW